MIFAGDICLADLNEETRRHVLVVSSERFHRLAARVIVAPQVIGESPEVSYPWRVEVDGRIFALDHLRGIAENRLLDRVDRAPAAVMANVRKTFRHII